MASKAVARVLRRELWAAAAEYDAALQRALEGTPAMLGPEAGGFVPREVERFKRYASERRRTCEPWLVMRGGSWRANASDPTASVSKVIKAIFNEDEVAADQVEAAFAALRMVTNRHDMVRRLKDKLLDSEASDDVVAKLLQEAGVPVAGSKAEIPEDLRDALTPPMPEFSKNPKVTLDIGNVFRHRKHGFRGVIVSHFSCCPAPPAWIERWGPFENGANQAFYRTLVDTKDRPDAFQALAAEENLEYLPYETVPVEHPELDVHFDGFEFGHHMVKGTNSFTYEEEW